MLQKGSNSEVAKVQEYFYLKDTDFSTGVGNYLSMEKTKTISLTFPQSLNLCLHLLY